MSETSRHVDSDPLSAIDQCYEQGWAADGLPVVPPERSRVESMMANTADDAESIVCRHPTTGMFCTVQAAAVNAVMAGCLPEYFPVVLAALRAADKTPYNFHGSAASTGGSTPVLVVSGPVVERIGMNSAGNVFGPGNRANATLGRTLRLIIMNVFKMIPGISDQSTQGFPGKYSMCIAERADRNPWEPLHIEQGYDDKTSTVTVFAGAGFCNIENHGGSTPEAILECVADAMANLGVITLGQSIVVLSPEHAQIVSSSGWSKDDVRKFLFEHARRTVVAMKRVGKYVPGEHKRQGNKDMHRGLDGSDILVTVAGGDAGGHSAFIPSWSRARASIMQTMPIDISVSK